MTVQLTPQLLQFIRVIQAYKEYKIQETGFLSQLNLKGEGYLSQSTRFFRGFPLEEMGLDGSDRCFLAVIDYRVTPEMIRMGGELLQRAYEFHY